MTEHEKKTRFALTPAQLHELHMAATSLERAWSDYQRAVANHAMIGQKIADQIGLEHRGEFRYEIEGDDVFLIVPEQEQTPES